MIWRERHRWARPPAQNSHEPQVTSGLTATRRPRVRPRRDTAGGLVPQDQGCRAPRVVPMIGMHVRTADTDRVDADHHLAVGRHRIGLVAEVERVRCGIDERFHGSSHFAVKPPST